MATVAFVGPAARDQQGRPHGTSRLVNVYPAPGERSPIVLRPVPGMRRWVTQPGIFCRAMETIGGELYAVHGGRLARLTETGARVEMMPVADDPETTLAGLEDYFVTVAGGSYKVYTPALATSTPGTIFTASASAVVLSRRAVVTEKDGRRFQWSAVGDPTSMGGLDFATAEQTDETLIRGFAVNGELWLFKANSIERWYPAGATGFAYVAGSLMPIGLKGFRLICPADAGAFFVGSDGRAYLAGGGTITPVTAPGGPVESSIAGAEPVACLRARYEGREVLSIVFADRPAWCLDVGVGQWHERAQGPDLGRWQATAGALAYGRSFVGTDAGGVFALDGVGEDDGAALHRVMVSTTVQNERRLFRLPKLEVQAHVGRGSVTADRSRPPQVRMRLSRDFGQTWAEQGARSLGEEGQYSTRLIWRALGQARAATFELRCAEPLDVGFDAAAFLEVA